MSSTSLYWTTDCIEDYTREGARQKVPRGFKRHDDGQSGNNCLCRGLGASLSCRVLSAYQTCIKCRYVLNVKESWSIEDGNFHADIFFHNIMALFDDEEWAEDTLEWWNK